MQGLSLDGSDFEAGLTAGLRSLIAVWLGSAPRLGAARLGLGTCRGMTEPVQIPVIYVLPALSFRSKEGVGLFTAIFPGLT